ncbi:MAG: Rnase Y domain-containing protein, partial [Patescibacteria group bacterium]
MSAIIYSVIAAAVGIGLGYLIRKQIGQSSVNSAEAKAERILAEAKNNEKEAMIQAKEKTIKMIDEAKKEEEERRQEIRQLQSRLEKRETLFDQKLLSFEDNKTKLEQKIEEIKNIKLKIDELKQQSEKKLEEVARLSRDDAKNELLQRVEEESKADLFNRVSKLEKENGEFFDQKAKEIVINSMQRCA